MWIKVAKCMVNGYSIRKNAKIVEINIATSLFWIHKNLDCISPFLGKGYVDGVIEADEVFNLKKWMNGFNGVAAKYINNYIKWFKWLQIFDTDKEIIKAKNFIVQSNVPHSYIKIKDLKNREPMYV